MQRSWHDHSILSPISRCSAETGLIAAGGFGRPAERRSPGTRPARARASAPIVAEILRTGAGTLAMSGLWCRAAPPARGSRALPFPRSRCRRMALWHWPMPAQRPGGPDPTGEWAAAGSSVSAATVRAAALQDLVFDIDAMPAHCAAECSLRASLAGAAADPAKMRAELPDDGAQSADGERPSSAAGAFDERSLRQAHR